MARRDPLLAKRVTKDMLFPPGTLVRIDGRDGVFRVVSTSELTKGKTRMVRCYLEPDGKFEQVLENHMTQTTL